MSEGSHEIAFAADVIRFDGPGGWHGVYLPEGAAAEARFFGHANPLGAIAVRARIGRTQARTSLFPDKARDTYLLPLKAALRRNENIKQGDRISVTLLVDP